MTLQLDDLTIGSGNSKVAAGFEAAVLRAICVIGLRLLLKEDPLVKFEDGSHCYGFKTYWVRNQVLHRDDGPAWIEERLEQWFRNGLVHRDGLPAFYYYDRCVEWWDNGVLAGNDRWAEEYEAQCMNMRAKKENAISFW